MQDKQIWQNISHWHRKALATVTGTNIKVQCQLLITFQTKIIHNN